jgi:hypothetical protein
MFYQYTSLTTIILGPTPPNVGTAIFLNNTTSPKTITFMVPDQSAYTGTPWADKMGTSAEWGTYWDTTEATRDNLTVALAELPGGGS